MRVRIKPGWRWDKMGKDHFYDESYTSVLISVVQIVQQKATIHSLTFLVTRRNNKNE